MTDIRSYIAEVRRAGELYPVRKPSSLSYEIAAVTAELDGNKAALFENIKGRKMRLVSNLVGTRKRFAMALGAREALVHSKIFSYSSKPRKPKITTRTPPFEKNSTRNLAALPIVRHFVGESGPFITSSVVHATNPETRTQNMSFHRIMPISSRRATIRMVENRHLDRCFVDAKEHGEDLRVSISIGLHPAVLIAGAYQAEWGHDELGIANAILGGKLNLSKRAYSGVSVPHGAEIVIDAKILCDVKHKEWMVEMLRTYDHKRLQPVLEIDRIYHRDNAIFHDILSGYSEHRLLMGMPAESKLDGTLRSKFGSVRKVALSSGGSNWLHAVVAIKKTPQTRVKQIIAAAFKTHRSLKQVTVVDEDIDIHSAESVEYAMATRFQAATDMTVLRNVRGSSLDPSSDQKKLKTSKLGIDATRPLSKSLEGFKLAKIPYKL